MAAAADSSLAMLSYTLAPKGRYPLQIRQATAALAHLLSIYQVSNIIISGYVRLPYLSVPHWLEEAEVLNGSE